MEYKEFEEWVGQYLEKRFPDHEIWALGSKDAWRQDVLARYYQFGAAFDIPKEELLTKSVFALWFTGGQKRG